MYNDENEKTIMDSLEQKIINLVNLEIVFIAQGYSINKAKKTKLDWFSILFNAFENIKLFDEEQQNNIQTIYNSI